MPTPTEKIPSTPSSDPDLTPRLRAGRAVRALLLGLSLSTPACDVVDEKASLLNTGDQIERLKEPLFCLEKLRSYSGEDELGPLLAEMDEALLAANLEREALEHYEGELDELIVSAHLNRAQALLLRFIFSFRSQPDFRLLKAANEHLRQASKMSDYSFSYSYEDIRFSGDVLERVFIVPFYKQKIAGCFPKMEEFAEGGSTLEAFLDSLDEARRYYDEAGKLDGRRLSLEGICSPDWKASKLLIQGAEARLKQEHSLSRGERHFYEFISVIRGRVDLDEILPILRRLSRLEQLRALEGRIILETSADSERQIKEGIESESFPPYHYCLGDSRVSDLRIDDPYSL